MKKCFNISKFSMFLLAFLVELISVLVYITIITYWYKAKQSSSQTPSAKEEIQSYQQILFISISETIIGLIALVVTSIFGAFAFYLMNPKRLKCYSISALLLCLLTFGILIFNVIYPVTQKADSTLRGFDIVFQMYKMTLVSHCAKLLFYIITVFISIGATQAQRSRTAPYIDKDDINENITPELYASYLEVYKHPEDNDIREEFKILRLKMKNNKSFAFDGLRSGNNTLEEDINKHLAISI